MSSPVFDHITSMLLSAGTPNCPFPATTVFNETWLLRLVLDWFAADTKSSHILSFTPGSRWYSEARLPSRFLATARGDRRAEGWTSADGIIGHFEIGSQGNSAGATLRRGASQLLVIESKLASLLAPGVANAPYFDQAARSVACLAEMVSRRRCDVTSFHSLGLVVLAPRNRIESGAFSKEVCKDSIREKVHRRVAEYQDREREDWFNIWFLPVLEEAVTESLSWEEVIGEIGRVDDVYGQELYDFYEKCLDVSGLSEGGR